MLHGVEGIREVSTRAEDPTDLGSRRIRAGVEAVGAQLARFYLHMRALQGLRTFQLLHGEEGACEVVRLLKDHGFESIERGENDLNIFGLVKRLRARENAVQCEVVM